LQKQWKSNGSDIANKSTFGCTSKNKSTNVQQHRITPTPPPPPHISYDYDDDGDDDCHDNSP
jgi:hypothetical protein